MNSAHSKVAVCSSRGHLVVVAARWTIVAVHVRNRSCVETRNARPAGACRSAPPSQQQTVCLDPVSRSIHDYFIARAFPWFRLNSHYVALMSPPATQRCYEDPVAVMRSCVHTYFSTIPKTTISNLIGCTVPLRGGSPLVMNLGDTQHAAVP